MIRLSQLTLRRGAKALLEGADLTLHAGDRAGLIGANGSGKTSLFALLRDELHADKGDVELPRALAHRARRAGDPGARPRRGGVRDRRRYGPAEPGSEAFEAETADDGTLIGELHAALGDADAYTARSRAETLLLGLGFSESTS